MLIEKERNGRSRYLHEDISIKVGLSTTLPTTKLAAELQEGGHVLMGTWTATMEGATLTENAMAMAVTHFIFIDA